jgi:hypothetical protein
MVVRGDDKRKPASQVRLFVGIGLVAALAVELGDATDAQSGASISRAFSSPAVALAADARVSSRLPVRTDPTRLLETALARCRLSVADYVGTLIKQERIAGELGRRQRILVKFRREPFSVFLHWVENPKDARRVLYVRGERVDRQGREMALVQPEGPIARLLFPALTIPIHGPGAHTMSRLTIDQFGFENGLALILKYARLAGDGGAPSLRYAGVGTVGERATHVVERRLPYEDGEATYPDRTLIVHLDHERLIPLAIHCYADDSRQELLASYVFSDVRLNVGLTDEDFLAKGNGF